VVGTDGCGGDLEGALHERLGFGVASVPDLHATQAIEGVGDLEMVGPERRLRRHGDGLQQLRGLVVVTARDVGIGQADVAVDDGAVVRRLEAVDDLQGIAEQRFGFLVQAQA
jgi:hypothetical protein